MKKHEGGGVGGCHGSDVHEPLLQGGHWLLQLQVLTSLILSQKMSVHIVC